MYNKSSLQCVLAYALEGLFVSDTTHLGHKHVAIDVEQTNAVLFMAPDAHYNVPQIHYY